MIRITVKTSLIPGTVISKSICDVYFSAMPRIKDPSSAFGGRENAYAYG